MRQRDRNTWVVTVAALVTSVFAIGGAHRYSVIAIGLLSATALCLQVTSQRRLAARTPLLFLLAVAAGLTLLQLVPLPAGVMSLLDPEAHDLITEGATLAGAGAPSIMPLSLDPPGTLFELVKLGSYLALAYVCLRMAASERGRVRILTAVALVIGAAAGIGFIHKLLQARSLYGLYQPRYAYAEFLGPLLNRNHFASLLAAGTLVSGGLATRERIPLAHRISWGACGVLCLVESLLIQSRGAAVGVALGMGVFGGILVLQRWLQESSRKNRRPDLAKVTIPATIVVLCGLTMVVFFSAGGVSEQLTATTAAEITEPHSKFVAWRSAATLIGDSPWIGVGRGAFEPAFTRVHPSSGFLTFSHVENEYLQAVVDWGIPGGLALAAIAAWAAMMVLRRWNGGALAASGLGVMVAVSAHSVVDFGLELPGLAVPILMVLATLTHVPVVEMSPARAARARLWRAGGAALLVAAVALLATPLGRTLHEDHNDLSDNSPPPIEQAREAMARHPVDYLSTAYVAAGMFQAGNVAGKYLLNHALLLHPMHPELHRLAAQMLAHSGRPAQALIEYQLAISTTNNPVELVRELVRMFPKATDSIKALPVRHLHPRRIARILVEEGHPEVALPYLKLVVVQYPRDLLTFKDLADLAEKQKDHAASEMAARRMAQLEPTQENLIALGHILVERKEWDQAERTAKRALDKHGQLTEVLEANMILADVYIGAQKWPAARQQLIDMRERPEIYLLARREIHRRLAAVEEALGNIRQAEWERQSAKGP